jgi:hypothetical protein
MTLIRQIKLTKREIVKKMQCSTSQCKNIPRYEVIEDGQNKYFCLDCIKYVKNRAGARDIGYQN